ncbi:MAG: ABC transporter permease [Candidatus Margulisbacteria bacterium]|nr:ABC transporter permease [Candidatus Margulisiibacteriota bacterium]
MITIIKIAYLNLWRRMTRTVLVIIMISVGLAAMIFSHGLYDGMGKQMISDTLRSSTGDIVIYKKGYRNSKLLSDYLGFSKIYEILQKDPQITAFAMRLKNEGMASSARGSQGVTIIGVNKEMEQKFINYKKGVVEGVFDFDGESRSAVIGQDLADKLKLKVGGKIVINAQSMNKELVAASFRVKGIIRTNNPEIDNGAVLLDLNVVQNLFQMPGQVSEFSLLLADKKNILAVKKSISQKLQTSGENIEVFTWDEIYPSLALFDKMFAYFIYISYIIVFLAVAIGLFNILLISIMERIKEFGIMLAVGTPFSTIKKIIYMESVLLSTFGYAFGSIAGFFVLLYYKTYGLDLSMFAAGLNSYGMASVIYAELHPFYFIVAFIAVYLTAFLSAIIPVRRLKKLRPVEAIRFV